MSHQDRRAPTRREQILKEAARLFAERGFHGVGVDEIGAAVGISGPGLYRHFAGQGRDARRAARRHQRAAAGRGGEAAPGGTQDVPAGERPRRRSLRLACIEGHIDFALDDRPLITLHDRELDRLRDSDRKLVRQLQRQYVELWVDVVREVHPRVPEEQARGAVHAVFGLLNSTPHLGAYGGRLPGRAATETLLRRLAHGAFAALGDQSGTWAPEETWPPGDPADGVRRP